ncbi:succinate dehydrogenase assembly factor 4 [Microbaculum marinum]|uniref:Succinate dehydrogenase assembly factor 4 n=1 Tax=Microbaculum marinum TaxID=1764581 RepID=A0AAW9RZJ6_9HYPH
MTNSPNDAEVEKRRKDAAKRALAEAEARRAEADAAKSERPKEYNGPKGPEPTRFGDWERKGIASDF